MDEFYELMLDFWDEEVLRKKTKKEVKEICASLELDESGTKDELINRILENNVLQADSVITTVKGERI